MQTTHNYQHYSQIGWCEYYLIKTTNGFLLKLTKQMTRQTVILFVVTILSFAKTAITSEKLFKTTLWLILNDNHSQNTPICVNLLNTNKDLSQKCLFTDSNSPIEQPVPKKPVTVAFIDGLEKLYLQSRQKKEKIIEQSTVKMSRFGRVI